MTCCTSALLFSQPQQQNKSRLTQYLQTDDGRRKPSKHQIFPRFGMHSTQSADEVTFSMCSASWTGSISHASELTEAAEAVRGSENEGMQGAV